MGARQSRGEYRVSPDVTTTSLVNDFFKALFDGGYPRTNDAKLRAFGEHIVKKYTSLEDCRDALRYYKELGLKKNKHLFDTALSINLQTEQSFLLNKQSLVFLSLLNTKNKVVYDALMLRLKNLCKINKVFLRGYHLDTVIDSLCQQMKLPERVLEFIPPFLKDQKINYKAVLHQLRLVHRPKLDSTAKDTKRLHHAAPHALEIRERTMLMLNVLGLFPDLEEGNTFIRDLISFMIEFHDEEQINKGPFMSVEEATVDHILTWLHKPLQLDTRPQLKELIAYLANRVIILGTTMIFSPLHTLDLSELYLLIEDSAIEAELVVIKDSNRPLDKLAKAAMLVTGICDKNPAALPAVVTEQASNVDISTLMLLNNCFKAPLFMEQFFATAAFKPYYKEDGTCSAVDHQAFLMTLTPHLSMRTELSAKAKPELASALISFIADCRLEFNILNEVDFILWFNQEFTKRSMAIVVPELFFTAIASEVSFSRSQLDGLKSTLARLKQYKLINEADTSFVEILVPERDALNLSAFDLFYRSLDRDNQLTLLKEMLITVVLQAGAIYLKQHLRGFTVAVAASAVTIVEGSDSCYSGGLCFYPMPTVAQRDKIVVEDDYKMMI